MGEFFRVFKLESWSKFVWETHTQRVYFEIFKVLLKTKAPRAQIQFKSQRMKSALKLTKHAI